MIQMAVTVDADILEAYAEAAQKAPGLTRTAYRRAVGRLRSRILRPLQVEPPLWPANRRRRWKSERQRRAYFATDGFGAGIPYIRTHRLVNSYDVEVIDAPADGGILQVVNNDPKAKFVVGDWAQPMHLDTGWIQVADVVSDARREAEDVLIETWFTVVDTFAGVPR